MSETATNLLVKHGDVRSRRIATAPVPDLQDGEAMLRVDCFALTANTVTYAVFGEQLRYWDFFPSGEEGVGRVPCWGHGNVIASNAAGIDVGARFYGYFPIGTHLVVKPARVHPGGFTDGAAHRQPLPPVYNSYIAADGDPDAEATRMLFRPLFTTSWVIDIFLAGSNMFGAKRVVLSSASSKTALGLAWSLKRRGGVEVVGLTSSANAAFAEKTGYYDRVLVYDSIASLSDEPTIYVDFAGSASVRKAIHEHLKDQLVYDCGVGATDWSAGGPPDPTLPGAQPTFFFAPTHIEAKVKEIGREAFDAKLAADSAVFNRSAAGWMHIVRDRGADAVNRWWGMAVDNKIAPQDGVILGL